MVGPQALTGNTPLLSRGKSSCLLVFASFADDDRGQECQLFGQPSIQASQQQISCHQICSCLECNCGCRLRLVGPFRQEFLTAEAWFHVKAFVHIQRRAERSGEGGAQSSPRSVPLLLVVHRGACCLFSLRIGPVRGYRAAFAIGRDDDATAGGGFASLLDVES